MNEPKSLTELKKELNLTEDEIVDLAVDQLGMTPSYVRFVLEFERGETTGDIIETGKDEE